MSEQHRSSTVKDRDRGGPSVVGGPSRPPRGGRFPAPACDTESQEHHPHDHRFRRASTLSATTAPAAAQPLLHQRGAEIQHFGTVKQLPIALSHDARMYACQRLNRLLADTQMLYGLYKKHHWLMRGATFHQLHLLLDQHATAQLAVVDALAERVQSLGGVAVGDPRHAAEITSIPRPPNGVEEVPAMLSRLLEAHETILGDARDAARKVAEQGDDGSNDMIVSEVIRTGETQAWFLAEHLVDTPLTQVSRTAPAHPEDGAARG